MPHECQEKLFEKNPPENAKDRQNSRVGQSVFSKSLQFRIHFFATNPRFWTIVNEIYSFWWSRSPVWGNFVHIFVYFATQKTEYFELVNFIYLFWTIQKNSRNQEKSMFFVRVAQFLTRIFYIQENKRKSTNPTWESRFQIPFLETQILREFP